MGASNNQHHGENWAVAVLVSIPLALHSKPKPRHPSFACAGRSARGNGCDR